MNQLYNSKMTLRVYFEIRINLSHQTSECFKPLRSPKKRLHEGKGQTLMTFPSHVGRHSTSTPYRRGTLSALMVTENLEL